MTNATEMTAHDMQVQIEAFTRSELRAACKAANIQYSKLDTAGMRGALIALIPQDEPAAPAPQGRDAVEGGTVQEAPVAKTGLKIEKDRPEQNGIKRPSAGGRCRAVWEELDAFVQARGEQPTSKDVKVIAAAQGWNANNASIEFYQWRKYNGITGRVAKA